MLRPNRYDYIKILALISMIIDHIGYFIFPQEVWFRIIGRIAFPLFLLLVWYNNSYRRRRSLRICAIGVQIMLWRAQKQGFVSNPVANILIAIALTRIVLEILMKYSWIVQSMVLIISLILTPYMFAFVDYGTMSIAIGIVWAWIFLVRDRRIIRVRSLVVIYYLWLMILHHHFTVSQLPVLVLIGAILIWCGDRLHNGNRHISLWLYWDRLIYIIARYALYIYIVHGVVLMILWQWLK